MGTACLLPDILGPNLDVVFVGAAPSLTAARSGHYYAGQRNRFWQLLYQSGFTPRQLDATEDREVLLYGIGLTAILPYCISAMNAMLPAPSEEDRKELRRKLAACAPQIVCYNGKDVYRMCSGEPDAPWGLLPERIGDAIQFVVHSSSGRADRWGTDRLFLFRELRRLVQLVHMSGGEHRRMIARMSADA